MKLIDQHGFTDLDRHGKRNGHPYRHRHGNANGHPYARSSATEPDHAGADLYSVGEPVKVTRAIYKEEVWADQADPPIPLFGTASSLPARCAPALTPGAAIPAGRRRASGHRGATPAQPGSAADYQATSCTE